MRRSGEAACHYGPVSTRSRKERPQTCLLWLIQVEAKAHQVLAERHAGYIRMLAMYHLD